MSKVFLSVAFAILLLSGCSKSYKNVVPYSGTGYSEQNRETDNSQDEIYPEHETIPQFPGGEGAMLSYIYDNLKYPKDAFDKNIQGRVVLTFLVRKTGEVDSVKIIRGKDPSLDAEAMRLILGFPRFKPATFDLEPVDWRMALSIKFNMADYDERYSKRYPAFHFDNGDDYVVDGMYRIVDDQGRIGYADENGNTVITPRFKCAFPFENGKARVADTGEERRYDAEHWYWESDDRYYIDKTGRKID
ncbi:MAG: TonB family protein [Paenibacillus sp.]|nr:TonB family protein [Paenibacillus sp.]